jgi:hypothetical protein
MNKKSQNHIDCGTALEWIHLLLDKELPPPDHQKLQAHLHGCLNCSAAYRELNLIENAHGALDRSLDAVPSGYFEELPDRVMTRLARAEKRAARAFSLPKPQLPKWQMPAGWRQLIFGRGKYALAFATVLLLTFIVTRQLRQDVSSTTVLLEHSPGGQSQPAPEKPAAGPAQTEEQAQGYSSEVKKTPESHEVEHHQLQAPATPTPAKESPAISAGRAKLALEPEQDAAKPEEVHTPPTHKMEAELVHFDRRDTGEAADFRLSTLDALVAKEPALSRQNTAGAGVAAQPAAESYAPTGKEAVKTMSRSAYSTAAARPPANAFQQAVLQARQAASEQHRRRVWQEFLKTDPDSVHFGLAVAEIGRSFAAEIDSASSSTQIEEALQFYVKMEKILGSHGNEATFARERGRLENLLRWKQKQ